MIVVVGATGTVGRPIVEGLLARGEAVRAITRAPRPSVLPPQVEQVRGDLDDPRSISEALAGAKRVFVMTAASGPGFVEQVRGVARALRAVCPERVVLLSSVAAIPPVPSPYGAAHAQCEDLVHATGCPATLLRPSAFMSNVLQWLGMLAGGTVYAPYAYLPRAVIDPDDVAAVAVRALTVDGHADRTYVLTGPASLSAAEQVERMAVVLGRPLRLVEASPAEVRKAMVEHGFESEWAQALLDAQADPDPNRGRTPTGTVEEILGRPARTFDDWLAAHRDQFAV